MPGCDLHARGRFTKDGGRPGRPRFDDKSHRLRRSDRALMFSLWVELRHDGWLLIFPDRGLCLGSNVRPFKWTWRKSRITEERRTYNLYVTTIYSRALCGSVMNHALTRLS